MPDDLQSDIDGEKEKAAWLVGLFIAGVLTVAAWERAMQEEIRALYIRAYVLGRGGIDIMNEADWAAISAMLADQFGYLHEFGLLLAGLSEAEAIARAALYMQSATQAWSLGQTQTIGGGRLVLPAHPGDGSTQCGTNCRCEWRITEKLGAGWDCYWLVDAAAESCTDCIRRGEEWNPLVVMPQ